MLGQVKDEDISRRGRDMCCMNRYEYEAGL